MLLSFDNNILIGLEYICTQGPLWLIDYTIDNWNKIFQAKFQRKFQLSCPSINFEIENYRLFSDIPEIVTQRILHFITNTADFYSVQLVCKQWYTVLHEEIFWCDLYLSRYGAYPKQAEKISSWKMLYLLRMEAKIGIDNNRLDQLVENMLMSKINYVLSNSFYYQIEKTSDEYSVRLILVGLEDKCSRSKIHLTLRVGEYGSSRFTDEIEELAMVYESSTNKEYTFQSKGPSFFGFHLEKWGYVSTGETYFKRSPSALLNQYPSSLLMCLFIMMVHPDHRAHFIMYLKGLRKHCFGALSLF